MLVSEVSPEVCGSCSLLVIAAAELSEHANRDG